MKGVMTLKFDRPALRSSLALAVACGAAALSGCNPSKDLEQAPPPAPPQQKPQPDEVAPKPTKQSTPTKPKSAQIPDRVNQLADLQKATIRIGGHKIDVWVMDNDSKREEGMMFLKDKDVAANQGMIFIFPAPQQASNGFWMHNTLIPLDIIYVSPNKTVLNVQHGKPKNDTNLPSTDTYGSVIELKGGEAEKLGIVHGTKVEIPSTVAAIE